MDDSFGMSLKDQHDEFRSTQQQHTGPKGLADLSSLVGTATPTAHPDVRQSLLRLLLGAKGQGLLFGKDQCKSMIWAWSQSIFWHGFSVVCLIWNKFAQKIPSYIQTTLQGTNIYPLNLAGKIEFCRTSQMSTPSCPTHRRPAWCLTS